MRITCYYGGCYKLPVREAANGLYGVLVAITPDIVVVATV